MTGFVCVEDFIVTDCCRDGHIGVGVCLQMMRLVGDEGCMSAFDVIFLDELQAIVLKTFQRLILHALFMKHREPPVGDYTSCNNQCINQSSCLLSCF